MTKLESLKAQLRNEKNFTFKWLSEDIGLIITKSTTLLVRNYGAEGFALYAEMPNQTVAESVEIIRALC